MIFESLAASYQLNTYATGLYNQTASFARLETALREGTEDAVKVRAQLMARMHDLSEFMKTLKQRFSITDGVVLWSAEFVRSYAAQWQAGRSCGPAVAGTAARGGAAWGDLAVVNKLRRAVFGST
ncbi:MAG: hypothetical protein EA353_07125 [Puniceicoccaceae bacterium]|nr:MAG: hypothetical protein EA353_07125 [Puniceicoccaceae bacterium]